MRLSISNIAWSGKYDEEMYSFLQSHGFSGLEIAPTRLFPDKPYEQLENARAFTVSLKEGYGLSISSMQSIWYGKTQSIFGSKEERRSLLAYTRQAVDFAAAMGCGNLVFGCPKNRNVPKACPDDKELAAEFFRETADYAAARGTVIALEPNPPIYGTNFINTTLEAFEFVKAVGNDGFKVNVDLGTLIHYGEELSMVEKNIDLVNHIHISEPHLVPIEKRGIHAELKNLSYDRYASIEMGTQASLETVKRAINYIGDLLK